MMKILKVHLNRKVVSDVWTPLYIYKPGKKKSGCSKMQHLNIPFKLQIQTVYASMMEIVMLEMNVVLCSYKIENHTVVSNCPYLLMFFTGTWRKP